MFEEQIKCCKLASNGDISSSSEKPIYSLSQQIKALSAHTHLAARGAPPISRCERVLECRWGRLTKAPSVGSWSLLASISKSSVMGPRPPKHEKERADMLDKLLIFSWSCYIAHLSLWCRQLLTEWGEVCSCLFLAELSRDLTEKYDGVGVKTCRCPVCLAIVSPIWKAVLR